MALSRKGKIWLVVLSIPVFILVAAAGAAKIYFTSERLKALVIPRLQEATHRSVDIQSISLSVLPSLAVEIDSLTIANRSGRGFSAEPFASLGRLVLKVRVMSLVQGKIEITSVIIDQPHLLLEVNEWGDANYAGLSPPPDTAAHARRPAPQTGQPQPSGPTATQGAGLLLSNLQIRNGSIDYIDRKGNSAMRISGLSHTMRLDIDNANHELRLDGQSAIDRLSYGTVRAALLPDLRLTLDEDLVYNTDQDVLTIRKGTLSVQDMVLSASGTVSHVTKSPVLALAIESNNLNIADLFSLVPQEYMKKAGGGLKGTGMAQVRLTVNGVMGDSSKPEIKGTITASDASLQYAKLPQPITNVSVVSSFERSTARQQFTLERFSASLGNNHISASMRVVNFDDPWLTLTVQAALNLAEVKDYYPLEPGTEVSGSLSADLRVAGKVSAPTAMSGSGTMDFRNVTVKMPGSSKPVENMQGKITITNSTIDSRKISMTLGRSDLALAFTVKNYLSMVSEEKGVPRATATISLTSNHLATADIMTDSVASRPVSPGSSASAGAQQQADRRQKSQAKKGGLVLPNVDMDVAASIGTLAMEKFTFTNMRAAMNISNGVITLRSCTLNSFDGSVSVRGTLNLQKPEQPQFDFAMDMTNVDAHAMLSKFSSFGERMFGRLTMNTTLKGALDDTLGLVPPTLNGQGRVQAQNGSLTGVKVNKEVASLLKLPDLETIHYKDWSNDFSVANGRLVIKDLKINSTEADYLVNGSQGLDGSLDYSMALILAEKTSSRITIAGFAGQAVDLFRDNTGRVRLDFAVGGTMDAPRVSLNTDAAKKKAEDLVKKKAAEEAKKVGDQLKTKGEDLLKGLFKKKK